MKFLNCIIELRHTSNNFHKDLIYIFWLTWSVQWVLGVKLRLGSQLYSLGNFSDLRWFRMIIFFVDYFFWFRMTTYFILKPNWRLIDYYESGWKLLIACDFSSHHWPQPSVPLDGGRRLTLNTPWTYNTISILYNWNIFIA